MADSTLPRKNYRVAQWAAGRIGQSAMRAVVGHPDLTLVGLKVHSASKEGQDAGTLAGVGPIGIKATRSVDEIVALKPDCVLYMQEGFDADDLCRLLGAGINVVTTRNEFFYGPRMRPELRERINAACTAGGASIYATGSSPGFITAEVPMALMILSRTLRCVTIDEFADIPGSTSPEMIFNVMGMGRPLTGSVPEGMLHHMAEGFEQSLGVTAAAIGRPLDKVVATGEFAAARSDIDIPGAGGGVIKAGTVAAQRIVVTGLHAGKPLIVFRANWYCSRDLDNDWQLAENGWRIQLDSDTPMDVSINFPKDASQTWADQMSGLTAHPAVNAIPYVCEAAPGICATSELPRLIPHLLV